MLYITLCRKFGNGHSIHLKKLMNICSKCSSQVLLRQISNNVKPFISAQRASVLYPYKTQFLKRNNIFMISKYFSTSPNIFEHRDIKAFNNIPGPPRLPFIGSIWPYKLGIKVVDRYHEYLRDMYEKYGPLVREEVGPTTIVHVFDPEDIRTVYHSTVVPYIAPLLQTAKDYKQEHGFKLGLGNTNGPEWESLRRAVNKFTLKPQAANSHIPKQDAVSCKAVQLLEQHLVQSDGSVPQLEECIDRWITESLGVVVGGESGGYLDYERQRPNDLAVVLANASRCIFEVSAHLKLSTGLYRHFSTPKARALKRAEDTFYGELHKLCLRLIAAKEDSLADDQDDSILANMMKDNELTRPDLLTITMSLLTDGYSTTAPSLLAALHCLAIDADTQEVLRRTALQSPAGEPLTVSRLATMTDLTAFLKEVFRLFPIGDGVQRLLTKDMTLSGYHLPAGTQLDLNPYIWLKDPSVFPDPLSIRLERWSRPPGGGVTDLFHPILNTPFSTGARTCVGRRLAEHDISCFIVRLLQRFRVSLAGTCQPRQVYRVLLRPDVPLPLLHRIHT